jgi:hypothetical protein
MIRHAGLTIVGGERAAAIEANGARLLATMPATSESAGAVSDDNVGRSFYARGVVGKTDTRGPIPWYLNTSLEEGLPLFLRGTAHGVGTTRLVTDFARAQNAHHRHTTELLVAYTSIAPKTKTVRALVESILAGIEAHLPARVGRGAGAFQLSMLKRVLQHFGVRCLVIDHVDRLEGPAVGALVDLMEALACSTDVRVDGAAVRRIGVVLVAKPSPSRLFRGELRLLQRLEGRIIELDRYQQGEDVIEALGQVYPRLLESLRETASEAEVGLDLLRHTIGLPGRMMALFGMMERLRTRHPDATFGSLLEAAMRQLPARVELGPEVVLGTGERQFSLRLASTVSPADAAPEEADEPVEKAKDRRPSTRAEMLAQKAKNRERADRALRRSRRIKSPTVRPTGTAS